MPLQLPWTTRWLFVRGWRGQQVNARGNVLLNIVRPCRLAMKPLLHCHINFAPATVFSPHFGVRIGCHALSRCCLKAESAHSETRSKLTARVRLTCLQRLSARQQCNENSGQTASWIRIEFRQSTPAGRLLPAVSAIVLQQKSPFSLPSITKPT